MSSLFNLILSITLGLFVLRGVLWSLFFGSVWLVILFDKACDLAVWPLEKLFPEK